MLAYLTQSNRVLGARHVAAEVDLQCLIVHQGALQSRFCGDSCPQVKVGHYDHPKLLLGLCVQGTDITK
jgi:hypothetical protein